MKIPNIRDSYTSPTESVGDFVNWWNVKYPLDRWFRVRYKLAWGTKEHREVPLLTIVYEYEEEKVFRHLGEEKKKEEYTPGDWFNTEDEDIQSSQEMFEEMDLSQISESGTIKLK